MKPRVSLVIAAAIASLLLLGVAATAAAEEVYSPRTLSIARRLNCPVCTGESVADSQALLARQMRDTIEQKVRAGESDAQIIAYFRQQYGDAILAAPPKSGFSLALWWIPFGVVGLGALVVALFLRERMARPAPVAGAPVDDDELEQIAREVLAQSPAEVAAP